MTAKVVGWTSEKGGVGKSSGCIQTAYELRSRGKNVIIVDNDPQQTSYLHFKRMPENSRVPTVAIQHPLALSDISVFIDTYDYVFLDARGAIENDPRIKQSLSVLLSLADDERIPFPVREEIEEQTKEIFGVDQDVRASILKILELSDFVVIPWTPSLPDARGGLTVVQTLKGMKPTDYKNRYAFLSTNYNPRSVVYNQIKEQLTARKTNLFEIGFPTKVVWKEMAHIGAMAIERERDGDTTESIAKFTDELLHRLESA